MKRVSKLKRPLRYGSTPVLLLLVACATPASVETGRAVPFPPFRMDLERGQTAPNFRFETPDGTRRSLSAARGRVTILVFPAEETWPQCTAHRALGDLARDASRCWVDVRVISVGKSADGCPPELLAEFACDVSPGRMVLVCDPHGAVAELFSADSGARYFLLNNYLELEAVGALDDLDALRAQVDQVVYDIQQADQRRGMYLLYR